jgi:hypothetical protein
LFRKFRPHYRLRNQPGCGGLASLTPLPATLSRLFEVARLFVCVDHIAPLHRKRESQHNHNSQTAGVSVGQCSRDPRFEKVVGSKILSDKAIIWRPDCIFRCPDVI